MDIEIDVASSEAVYEQIVRQIEHGIRTGALAPGTPLPPIRQLANDLDLNHNTVAKAYKVLENNRAIRTAGQKGTFINSDAASHVDNRTSQDALYQMRNLVGSLLEKGLTAKQLQAVFRSALEAATS